MKDKLRIQLDRISRRFGWRKFRLEVVSVIGNRLDRYKGSA